MHTVKVTSYPAAFVAWRDYALGCTLSLECADAAAAVAKARDMRQRAGDKIDVQAFTCASPGAPVVQIDG